MPADEIQVDNLKDFALLFLAAVLGAMILRALDGIVSKLESQLVTALPSARVTA